MELYVQRRESKNDTTIGELVIDDTHFCFTLEDQIREVAGEPVEKWKIAGQTAIPVGKYKLALEDSSRFGPDTLTVKDVPGFTSIRIHSGNTAADTEGCLLVGEVLSNDKFIGASKSALANLKAKLVPVIKSGEPCHITYANC